MGAAGMVWSTGMKPPRRGRPPNALHPDDSSAARLGFMIRSRRDALGMTLESLARLIGFSPQHISEVERARAPASRPFVAACDRALAAHGELLDLHRAVVYEQAAERHDRSTARRRGSASPSSETTAGADDERAWRASARTADDLAVLVDSYRRAYAGTATVTDLLPGASGLMHVLIDLGRRDQWPGSHARLASLVGQSAVLVGLLHLMGPRNLGPARAHYNLALRSAREAQDLDLTSYVLGSLAFHAVMAQRPTDAETIMGAAWDLASRKARPRTRAWTAALASELHARAGQETRSRRLLEQAFDAMDHTRSDPAWQGIGQFDHARLSAYEGGNLLLLGKHAAAAQQLRDSLKRLDPSRLKHRCTASADLAMALALREEVDESCAHAMQALDHAMAISHRESIDRVRGVHARLQRWRAHQGVQELTERLHAA